MIDPLLLFSSLPEFLGPDPSKFGGDGQNERQRNVRKGILEVIRMHCNAEC